MLDVDPCWRMHQVSDGQRRRVQICVGLLKLFKVNREGRFTRCGERVQICVGLKLFRVTERAQECRLTGRED